MSFDYEDYEKLRERKGPRRVRTRAELDFLAQAEVAAAQLTGDPAWDAYLQVVQGWRREFEDELTALQEALVAVDAQDLYVLKLRACRARAQIDLLDRVIDLPTQMREAGREARESLGQGLDS